MKIGICITTFNRPEYLKKTLESLKLADLHDSEIFIVDDCSTNIETLKIISDYKRIRNQRNLSIRYSLQIGFDHLINEKCDLLVNLDADVIVRKDFLTKLIELYKKFPDHIISGFNTLTKSRTGIIRHPIVSNHDEYVTKKSIGGVNMMMSINTYKTIVRPALIESQKTKDHWDKIACSISIEKGKLIIVSSPSVVQHIGFDSAMGHRDNPDIAYDFISDVKQKLCVLQPHGLGDIIFCQTLIRSFKNPDIVWPVLPIFIEGLKRAYPDIEWVIDIDSPIDLSIKKDCIIENYRVIPIRWSDQIARVNYKYVMRSKYDIYRLKWQDWKKDAMWNRDLIQEDKLFQLLKLKPKEYVLKNLTFMSNSSKKIQIDIEGIEMQQVEGFSLFDWAKVFENAKEIHTVSTSILYLLDMLNTGNVYVYIRKPSENNHDNYKYIFTNPKFIYK